MDDLLREFLDETNEALESLDADFVTLEQDPSNADIVGNIFRVMHTIKGTCGFLGLERLEKVAHAAEDVMDNIRDGKLSASPEVISVIFHATDCIKDIVEKLGETGAEPTGDDSALIAELNQCAAGGASSSGAAATANAATSTGSGIPDIEEDIMTRGGTTPDLDMDIDFEPVMADFAADEAALPAAIDLENNPAIDAEIKAAEAALAKAEAESESPRAKARGITLRYAQISSCACPESSFP